MSPNEKIVILRGRIKDLENRLEEAELRGNGDRALLVVTAFIAVIAMYKSVIQAWLP